MDANQGHAIGYGGDPLTQRAIELFKKEFGEETEVFFVLTGTGANILSLQSGSKSFQSILCTETAHIHVDECGAPEKFTGSKLIPIPSQDGKIHPADLIPRLIGFGVEHHAQPGILSISQVTEMGTVYSREEIRILAEIVHDKGMFLHMDGARIANAAVSLGMEFREFTKDAGVDILSFGGTKNGLMLGEAVLLFNPELIANAAYYRKQAAQLCSKMRFISAQFIPYLEEGIWRLTAEHANKMAKLLFQQIDSIPEVVITQSVDANGIFAKIPKKIIPILRESFFFYDWNEATGEVRWMTSFDTTQEDINAFTDLLKATLKG